MIRFKKPDREYTLDEMIDFMHNPKDKRSLSELDLVVGEITDRHPDWAEEIVKHLGAAE